MALGWRGKILAAVTLGLCLLTAAAPARALSAGDDPDPQNIQKKIDRLRVFYTDDHPEVIRLREYLRKAKEMEKEKKAKQRDKDPKKEPSIERDFKSNQSFD